MRASRSRYSSGVTHVIIAPTRWSRSRFASGSRGATPRNRRCGSIPILRAASAVARQWFDWIPPHVMTFVFFVSIASARRSSSFRTLLPESSKPVRSSRLTWISRPSRADARRSGSIGVGNRARDSGVIESGYHRPVPRIVAVTCDRKAGAAAVGPNAAGRIRPTRALVFVQQSIVDALVRLGCEPVLVPPAEREPGELVEWLLTHVQGVVLTGGPHDLDPAHYGSAATTKLRRVDAGRDALELALARGAWERRLPLLGVCGGMQAMTVAVGGTLLQDIRTHVAGALEHEQPTDPAEPWHDVGLDDGHLRRAFASDRIRVNSTHHQAVDDPGPLRIVGRAPDGIVEAVESDEHPFFVGVEWHPELLDPVPYAALAAALA